LPANLGFLPVFHDILKGIFLIGYFQVLFKLISLVNHFFPIVGVKHSHSEANLPFGFPI
jgi:hypothetical protein